MSETEVGLEYCSSKIKRSKVEIFNNITNPKAWLHKRLHLNTCT
ncbi:protein of unknown function, might related with transposase of ISAar19, ISL3 family [Shewanella benthica]|uniref:Uncharacterized protein n=1 Tax=Shewanella benthica TaxID=43661 RepID=A0A330M0S1_9GAMM|nr:protein of unknown function, might related with transposase of ISAar19, ISL3 family [Shewanella benthica]